MKLLVTEWAGRPQKSTIFMDTCT